VLWAVILYMNEYAVHAITVILTCLAGTGGHYGWSWRAEQALALWRCKTREHILDVTHRAIFSLEARACASLLLIKQRRNDAHKQYDFLRHVSSRQLYIPTITIKS
jgi:hypothetical protein